MVTKKKNMVDKSNFKLGFGKNNGGFMHVIDEAFDAVLNESKDGFAISKSELKTFREKKKIDFTSFEPQDELNPKIWDSNWLINSRVRMRLLDIADTFIDSLDIDWVEIDDIILTGSLANFNWSKFSDFDVHVVLRFKDVDERVEFVSNYFNSKKKIWNNEHDNLKIYGFPVEMYVQDSEEDHTSSGIYSLEKGHTYYTSNAGMLQLRREVCHYYERNFGVRYEDLIVITEDGCSVLTSADSVG